MIQLERDHLLKKMVKTFELIKVERKLLNQFRIYINNGFQEEAFNLLKNYNEKHERKNGVKVARPVVHGLEEGEVFTRLFGEVYVTARLFHADDRLLNAMWSEDWELTE